VGRISRTFSTTVPTGHVISSKPTANTHVDYRAKVSLVVTGTTDAVGLS
jgi:beta-lactam-binding protein with PASTA domain